MKKQQAGQAFILVLMLLAIGPLLVVPVLMLTSTSLKSSQIVTRRVKDLYAADAAQEYVLWKLMYAGYSSTFTQEGQTDNFTFNCCEIPVDMTVVMRAVPARGGIVLTTDDVIRPTKTVDPYTCPNNTNQTYTYTIRLEQLSTNTTQGLDAVYDILPKGFGTGSYQTGSSAISLDGGTTWQSIGNPLAESSGYGGQERLRWPASGSFTSDIREFTVRQVKLLKFDVRAKLPNNSRQCNWLVLAVGSVRTVSGAQAPITVGSPSYVGCSDQGLLSTNKTSEPSIILPGREANVNYTISITNHDGFTHQIEKITDYLPPEFFYSDNTTYFCDHSENTTPPNPPPSGITTARPTRTCKIINGVNRQELVWEFSPQVSIVAGETKTLTFWARTTKNVSGSYYNEALVLSDVPVPKIFSDIGVITDYYSNYTWNAGIVTVPAFDSRANAENITTLDANIALVVGGVAVTSYQVR